jgi:2-methylcitrate dehydratase PrpD
MQLDPEVDGAYPQRWLGRIDVHTTDGRLMSGAIDSPKGDPDNTLSRVELEDKFRRLLAFAGALDGDKAGILIERVWGLRDATCLKGLMEIGNGQ